MGSSSARARSRAGAPAGARSLVLPLLAATFAAGCAHFGPPGERTADRPTPRAAESPVPAPSESPSREERAASATDGRSEGTPLAPSKPDPSEEITPAELATIPEPVETPSRAAPEPLQTRSATPSPTIPGTSVWRVQVLATPERALADRVAVEAAERLGSTARVEREGSLYKVRLGAFATEAEAAGLRERAVEMGYPGAFRVKNGPAATDE